MLREIKMHVDESGVLRRDQFKIIYVAPMKALAQEIQQTFHKRLAPLGITVKELTGLNSLMSNKQLVNFISISKLCRILTFLLSFSFYQICLLLHVLNFRRHAIKQG